MINHRLTIVTRFGGPKPPSEKLPVSTSNCTGIMPPAGKVAPLCHQFEALKAGATGSPLPQMSNVTLGENSEEEKTYFYLYRCLSNFGQNMAVSFHFVILSRLFFAPPSPFSKDFLCLDLLPWFCCHISGWQVLILQTNARC